MCSYVVLLYSNAVFHYTMVICPIRLCVLWIANDMGIIQFMECVYTYIYRILRTIFGFVLRLNISYVRQPNITIGHYNSDGVLRSTSYVVRGKFTIS